MNVGIAAGPEWLVQLRDRFAGLRAASQKHARIIQSLPLGPGSRLLVVEFAGQRLLIGQARGSLVRLSQMPGDMPDEMS